MKMKHSNPILQNRAFTYYIKDYDSKKKIYTLENPITKDIKRITKEEFDKLFYDQNREKKPTIKGP